jgi:ATP-dependent DNA ligase
MRKYDGEFTYVVFDGEKVISVNPGGTVRAGLPCFAEAEKLLKAAKVRSCVLGAELYATGDVGNRNRVQEIVKLLRNPASEAALKKIGLAVFDVIEADGKPVPAVADVFKLLKKWLGKGKLVHPAEHIVTDKLDVVMETFTQWVIAEASEGLVVRHDRLGWYKIKLRHNLDAAIIGYSEGTENRKGMLHDLLVAVMRNDGTFHELARVGGGFTDEDRRMIFEEMRRRNVPSEYVAVNNDYVAYEMIAPGPVIEISCLDLIPESSKGDPVKRMVLDWDGKKYSALSRMPLASVISPQFVRMRDDKEANVEDVNIRQVSNLVPVADVDAPARPTDASPSKMLERTVYTKTMRGAQMVRKLLLWKTNKEDSGEFPGYVVYLTDFSPNRQNPLERDIKISNDEPTARRLFTELAAKNFVGGWEKVV